MGPSTHPPGGRRDDLRRNVRYNTQRASQRLTDRDGEAFQCAFQDYGVAAERVELYAGNARRGAAGLA